MPSYWQLGAKQAILLMLHLFSIVKWRLLAIYNQMEENLLKWLINFTTAISHVPIGVLQSTEKGI